MAPVVFAEADGCCIDLDECASSSKQIGKKQQSTILTAIWFAANHEDEMQCVLGRFLPGSERKNEIYHSCSSLLAEGS